MDIKKTIIDRLKKTAYFRVSDIRAITGVTRQAVNKHVKDLVVSGEIVKIGKTKNVKYAIRGKAGAIGIQSRAKYIIKGLREDEVFSELELKYNLKSILRKNVSDIFGFSFTEILNNAIDHSQSSDVAVCIGADNYSLSFSIIDCGVGIFNNIIRKFKLKDEFQAIQELIKGKTTTAKSEHSGAGLFYVSKIADELVIQSDNTELRFDNRKKDMMIQNIRHRKGTAVEFNISRNSRKDLKSIFDFYSGEKYEYEWVKTSILVKLFAAGKEYIPSRSEAKRLLYNLQKYKKIILDFKDIRGIGQGFADEIFRVFKNRYPDIVIETINTNRAVTAMIGFVKKTVDNKKK
ncbi:MAG: ArsR family transcriptional regulator [Elusimicrobia bacterium HGW-Elusimicrobia-2]|nr:MAG: ArsR family transcriptional regulator [Elusimicrobia bacterium HGW-Elusimicrobia-2]